MAFPPPLLTITNYQEMLSKLNWYTTGVAIILMFVLKAYVPPIQYLSSLIDGAVPADIIPFIKLPASSVGVFLMGIGVGILSSMVKLHDRISDVLQIRREFGTHFILYPLAVGSGASLTLDQLVKIRSHETLGQTVFYKYASSTQPLIDRHEVTYALTNWSWFWVCLEATFLTFVVSIVLAIYSAWEPTGVLLMICGFAILLMRYLRLQCVVHAKRQVDQILANQTWRSEVAAAFNAL